MNFRRTRTLVVHVSLSIVLFAPSRYYQPLFSCLRVSKLLSTVKRHYCRFETPPAMLGSDTTLRLSSPINRLSAEKIYPSSYNCLSAVNHSVHFPWTEAWHGTFYEGTSGCKESDITMTSAFPPLLRQPAMTY